LPLVRCPELPLVPGGRAPRATVGGRHHRCHHGEEGRAAAWRRTAAAVEEEVAAAVDDVYRTLGGRTRR
jgi:hypothetical protein